MKSLLAAAVLATLALAPAYAACTYPHVPKNIPDGNVATFAQMIAAQKAVNTYQSQMNAYLACLDRQQNATIAHASLKLTKKQIAEMQSIEVKRHNAAVRQLMSVANHFNTQLRIYEKKHPNSGSQGN